MRGFRVIHSSLRVNLASEILLSTIAVIRQYITVICMAYDDDHKDDEELDPDLAEELDEDFDDEDDDLDEVSEESDDRDWGL